MTVQTLNTTPVRAQSRTGAPATRRPSSDRLDHRRARASRQGTWSVREARACRPVAGRSARGRAGAQKGTSAPSAVGTRLYWTSRGIAVMVMMVALSVGVMLATVVGSFLTVSDAPPVSASTAPVVAVAPAGHS